MVCDGPRYHVVHDVVDIYNLEGWTPRDISRGLPRGRDGVAVVSKIIREI